MATFPRWHAVSRTPSYALSVTLPALTLSAVIKHLGVGTAVLTTPYTAERWASVAPSCGVLLYRNGVVQFSGLVNARELSWSQSTGAPVIKVEAVGDLQALADRLVFPDPLRAADDQSVNDYWMPSRSGTTNVAVPAATAMWQAISDAAGPTCAASRQVAGLAMGANPATGVTRTWTGLFDPLLTFLGATSVASGANLGVRLTPTGTGLTADIVAPSSTGMKFSADLNNLTGFTYREQAPTVTHALVAGQGNLHLRTRKLSTTTDPLATQWGRQAWSYIDRRDTTDATQLAQAGTDGLAQGAPKVNLTCTLTDSQAAAYGTDWSLGSTVTVYVGLPGQTKAATVTDVVREVSFTVADSGAEVIAPAIGTYDATALIPTPSQAQLARIGVALGNLIARTG